MTGYEVISVALSRGVVLDLTIGGRLVARGDRQAIEKVAQLVRDNRPAVLAALSQSVRTIDDLAEFDRLIDRLADLWRLPPAKRAAMRERRRRIAPYWVFEEIRALREQVTEAEALLAVLARQADEGRCH